MIVQYCPPMYSFILIGAGISGMELGFMLIKTFVHFSQLIILAMGSPMERRLHRWMFIYNTLSHLALSIGELYLLRMIVFEVPCFPWLSTLIGRNATATRMESPFHSSYA